MLSGLLNMFSKDLLFNGLAPKRNEILKGIANALAAKGYTHKLAQGSETQIIVGKLIKAEITPFVENDDLRLRYTFGITFLGILFILVGFLFFGFGVIATAIIWLYNVYLLRKDLVFESEHQTNKLKKDSPVLAKASQGESVDKFMQLKKLKDEGIISQEEFEAKKKKMLDDM